MPSPESVLVQRATVSIAGAGIRFSLVAASFLVQVTSTGSCTRARRSATTQLPRLCWPLFLALFDVHRDRVGRLPINGQHDVRLAASTQAQYQWHVYLVQAG